jgi:hypothetical protein
MCGHEYFDRRFLSNGLWRKAKSLKHWQQLINGAFRLPGNKRQSLLGCPTEFSHRARRSYFTNELARTFVHLCSVIGFEGKRFADKVVVTNRSRILRLYV